MQIKLSLGEQQVAIVKSALKLYGSTGALDIIRDIKSQEEDQAGWEE